MTITIERGSLAHLAIWLPLRALINTLEALYTAAFALVTMPKKAVAA